MFKLKTKIKRSSIKFILVAFLVAFAGAGFVFARKTDEKPPISSGNEQAINYGPPTDEEKKSANENKQRILDRDEMLANQPEPTADNKRKVKPLITGAEQYKDTIEVNAYVPGIFEDGGVCKATFSKGSSTVVKSVSSVKEGRAVYCPLISAPVSDFSLKGQWEIIVSYTSSTSVGSSDGKSVEIK